MITKFFYFCFKNSKTAPFVLKCPKYLLCTFYVIILYVLMIHTDTIRTKFITVVLDRSACTERCSIFFNSVYMILCGRRLKKREINKGTKNEIKNCQFESTNMICFYIVLCVATFRLYTSFGLICLIHQLELVNYFYSDCSVLGKFDEFSVQNKF